MDMPWISAQHIYPVLNRHPSSTLLLVKILIIVDTILDR